MDALSAPSPSPNGSSDELRVARKAFKDAIASPAGRKRLKQAGVKTARRLESDLLRIEGNTPVDGIPRGEAEK